MQQRRSRQQRLGENATGIALAILLASSLIHAQAADPATTIRTPETQEGVFIPATPIGVTIPAPANQSPLLGRQVEVKVRRATKVIEGRLLSVDSDEVLLSSNGTRRCFPIADVERIEAAPHRTGRAGKWLNIAGLGGIALAYWFGRIG
jgi:hypothetical protein